MKNFVTVIKHLITWLFTENDDVHVPVSNEDQSPVNNESLRDDELTSNGNFDPSDSESEVSDDVEVDNGYDNMEEDSGVEEIGMEDSEVEDSDGELLSDDEVFIMFSDTKPDQTWKLQG